MITSAVGGGFSWTCLKLSVIMHLVQGAPRKLGASQTFLEHPLGKTRFRTPPSAVASSLLSLAAAAVLGLRELPRGALGNACAPKIPASVGSSGLS